jgi:elongation factor P hydroxylase
MPEQSPLNLCGTLTATQVCQLFNQLFLPDYQTELCEGGVEPLYVPATQMKPARIVFREDFVASALHEVAHWCLAGYRRRQLVDYGYWYANDRSACDQARFEAVEARPQALEWVFSIAAGQAFRLSIDNLTLPAHTPARFASAVQREALQLARGGLPGRGLRFAQALANRDSAQSDTPDFLGVGHYEQRPGV